MCAALRKAIFFLASNDFKKSLKFFLCYRVITTVEYSVRAKHLGAFTTDTACQLDVFWHDGNTLGVDGAQVGVLEETDQVCFGCFLQSKNC